MRGPVIRVKPCSSSTPGRTPTRSRTGKKGNMVIIVPIIEVVIREIRINNHFIPFLVLNNLEKEVDNRSTTRKSVCVPHNSISQCCKEGSQDDFNSPVYTLSSPLSTCYSSISTTSNTKQSFARQRLFPCITIPIQLRIQSYTILANLNEIIQGAIFFVRDFTP